MKNQGYSGPTIQDFALDNFTNTDLVFAEGIATSAPEPETYAMLVAGLGLVGFIAYRKRQNNA